jgi:uncharacterized MAPEG superfamily protein
MHFAYWMVLAAILLPYVTVAFAKGGADFDNAKPREWLERQTGLRRRADWAHRNHFEALPPFAAGVVIAELAHAPQTRIDMLAGLFVVIRIVYTIVYLRDLATVRSAVWTAGLLCVIGLFVIGAAS